MELTSVQIPNKNRNAYSTQTARKRPSKILWAFQSRKRKDSLSGYRRYDAMNHKERLSIFSSSSLFILFF